MAKRWKNKRNEQPAALAALPPLVKRSLTEDIIDMRLAGHEVWEIAQKYAVTQKQVKEFLAAGLEAALPKVAEYTKEATAVLMMRSERVIKALWAGLEVGDPAAIKSWVQIEKNRQNALGVVTKSDVSVALPDGPMFVYSKLRPDDPSPDDWDKKDEE
jgi:hypothetical protein